MADGSKFPSQKGKRSNRAKGIPWAHTLSKALKQTDTGDPDQPNVLRKIADGLIECAQDPTSDHYEFAIKEIGARIDGSPKRGDEGAVVAAEIFKGISAAVTALNDFSAGSKVVHGETIVQNRSVLPSEVCAEESGYGEGLVVREVSGISSEP